MIEALALGLGTAVARTVLKFWLRDTEAAEKSRATFRRCWRNQLSRFWSVGEHHGKFERVAERPELAERLGAVFEIEFRRVPEQRVNRGCPCRRVNP